MRHVLRSVSRRASPTRASFVALLPLVLLALAGCGEGSGAEDQASAAQPPPPVTVAAPLVKPITEWDEFTGRFTPTESVEVRPRVSGYLTEVHFTDGQIVETGQLLFVIDPRPYQAALDQAVADREQERANLDFYTRDVERYAQLAQGQAASRQRLDQARQQRDRSKGALASIDARIRDAKLNIEFTRVRAPIKGRISDRRVDVGNLVTGDPNATLLTTIVALDPIYFVFDMSEADFLAYQRAVAEGRLKASTRDSTTPVELRLPDEEDGAVWPRSGRMNFVDNRLDPASGTIRARAVVPNADYFVTPGQFARLRLPGSDEYRAVLVPDQAIVTDQSNKMVMLVRPDGTTEARVIRPGPSYAGGLRIVRRGLAADDRIIINGLMRVKPGMKVTPQPGTIEAQTASAEG